MILKKHLEAYKEFSKLSSEVARTLAFAGIAIIWIFNPSDKSSVVLPKQLYFPLFCFAFGILFDVVQYLYGTIFHYTIYKLNIKKISNTNETDIPQNKLLYGIHLLFILKYFSLMTGYIFLVGYLLCMIK